jgi:NAD+ kinase
MEAMRVGLVVHPRRDVSPQAATIAEWGREHGVEVVAREADAARLGDGITPVTEQEFVDTSTGLVSLGGDGTMLGALRLVADDPRPVLGVNLGNLGFLAEVEPDDLPVALDRLRAGEYTIEPHPCLDIRLGGDRFLAFNDLALSRVPGAGFVEATLTVSGNRHGYFRADALIVATPTGSTAYSYAAGGPVVSPAAVGMLVTPASPASGISRPLFLSPDEPIQLELIMGNPAFEVDGPVLRHLAPGDVIDVEMRCDAGSVVRFDAPAFQQRNRLKLSLLDLPLLPDELRDLRQPPATDS